MYLAEDKCEGTEELDILPVSLVGPEAANALRRRTQTLCCFWRWKTGLWASFLSIYSPPPLNTIF